MEKVLWLIERVRSGLRSFVLEISHWMVLRGRADQLKLRAIILKHSFIENTQRYTTQEIANILKIPNQESYW